MNNKLFDITDLKGLKYYLLFATIVLAFYIYSMMVGYRFMSFNESSHSQERTGPRMGTRTFYHK